MRPVKAFNLKGTGRDWGGVIHVEWDCETRLPDDTWVLWNDDVTEFIFSCLDDSGVKYEDTRCIMDGMAVELKYEDYRDIPELINNWKEVMAQIMTAISWHQCECCNRVLFTFMQPFVNVDDVYDRQECDCTDEDFTDMLVEAEND